MVGFTTVFFLNSQNVSTQAPTSPDNQFEILESETRLIINTSPMWKYKYVVYSIIIKDSICKMLSEFWGKTLQNHLQLSEICLERIV